MNEPAIMQQLLTLAEQNTNAGGWPFSAVLVKDGEVLATGVNTVRKTHDPSDHAEMAAIRAASQKLQTSDLSGCTMYASGPPCAMCAACMIMCGITNIVLATDIPTKDTLLTNTPSTDKLYKAIGQGYGAPPLQYRMLKAYSAPIEALYKQASKF